MEGIAIVLAAAGPATGAICALTTLYVGKALSELRVTMLLDAQAREERILGKIEKINDKFEGKADKGWSSAQGHGHGNGHARVLATEKAGEC